MVHLSPDSAIKVKANPRKLFPDYIPQVRHEHVLADGGAECLGSIGIGPAERSALLSSGVLATDVERGAALLLR